MERDENCPPPPVPAQKLRAKDEAPCTTTARGRLLERISAARELVDKEVVVASTPALTARLPGERLVQRWGKKLDGAGYVIITAFLDEHDRNLRFDVHLASRCLRFSLSCQHQKMLSLDERAHAELVREIAMDLQWDAASQQLVFGPSVPAAWVSHGELGGDGDGRRPSRGRRRPRPGAAE